MKPIFLCFSPASLFFVVLFLLVSCPLPSLSPSLEGEESRRLIKALVGGGSQEETSLTSLLPAHPRPLIGRPCPPSPPPSPPRPLRFLSDGLTGPSRLLSNREWYGGGHGDGASAQEVWFAGHKLPQVSPGTTCRQRFDGPSAWTQAPVQREVGARTRPHRQKFWHLEIFDYSDKVVEFGFFCLEEQWFLKNIQLTHNSWSTVMSN